MLSLKLTILVSKADRIHLYYIMLFTSQTMLGEAKHLIESRRSEIDSKLKQPNHPTDPS